ncbi:MAG: hypothetical protein ACK4OM_03005 [Alphaproteobacteria bacterium]
MFDRILIPIRTMRMKYLPLLSIYFACSFAAFTKIAESFWIKNSLTLTPSEITSITIWANLPWTMKIIFSQFLDSVKIFGSQRNVYVIIAGIIMAIGYLINIGISNNFFHMNSQCEIYYLLIASGALIQLGLAVQDLVADTLCYDVVDKDDINGNPRNDKDVKEEIGRVQILVRIVDIFAAMLAAGISGWLASSFPYSVISYFSLFIVLISFIGLLIVPKEPVVRLEKKNMPIMLGGILYIFFIVAISFSGKKNSDVFILTLGTLIISFLIYKVCEPLEKEQKVEILKILLVLFAFRSTPTYGPGVEWWQIDVLKFDPQFFSYLDQLGIVIGFVGVWLLAKRFIDMNIIKSLFILNTIHVIFQIPIIAMAFGFHEWTTEHFGFGARTITLIDVTAEGPFQKLAFMLLCAAVTYHAPKQNVASWFALVMSLMSIAYIGAARVLKRILADLFIVERGNYENVADLMIATNLINFLLPTVTIIFATGFVKNRYIK